MLTEGTMSATSYSHIKTVVGDTNSFGSTMHDSLHYQRNAISVASELYSSITDNLSPELGIPRILPSFGVTGRPDPKALAMDHVDLNSDIYSLTDSNTKERTKQSVPRQIPTRFWDRKVSPEDVDIGQELGDPSPIWERYQTEAIEHDKTLSDGWMGDMDVLLVFAALFSAILTAFIIEFYDQLQPDPPNPFSSPSSIMILLHCIANHTACEDISSITDKSTIHTSNAYRWINTVWFTSLTISLLVSAVAILVKQWVHGYNSGLNGNPRLYGHLRQYRYNGIETWHMSGIIRALPSLMYFAVILFFVGLLILLANLDLIIYYICLSICVIAGFAYLATLVLPIIDPSCPFRTPASRFLDSTYQHLLYYGQKLCLFCIRQLLLSSMSIWHWITAAYVSDTSSSFNLKLLKFTDSIQSQLSHRTTFVHISEREMQEIQTQSLELDADALAWLSNTNILDTQDKVMQAISGLSLDNTLTKFHTSFKLKRPPSSFLIDAYRNPSPNSSHHHMLANYAQAYLIILSNNYELFSTPDTEVIEPVRNALQWYPSLTALGMTGDTSALSGELLSQAIKELGDGLFIVINFSSKSNPQDWQICLEIIIDLILQSIILAYLLFNDGSIQSQIVDSSFETLQIWMGSHAVLDVHSRPVYLLSLCSLVQLFSGITSSSQLYQCWFGEDRHKDTWTLLLRSLVTLPEMTECQDFPTLYPKEFLINNLNEEDNKDSIIRPAVPRFRHWGLLRCALQDCSSLLSNDRTTFNLVLELFLKTNPDSKEFWVNKNPFYCLYLIGPLFMPEDTLQVLNFFQDSLQPYTSPLLCRFLQARCRDLAHAEAIITSETFESMINDLLSTADFSALWLFATILQTLSQNNSTVLNGPISDRLLSSIHAVLIEKIQKEHPQTLWNYWTHWCLPFSLAASCQRLHLTYNIPTAGTGIIEVLRQLSVILATSEFRERKEVRNFIHTLLRLEEWERVR